jgi:elongation factor P
VIAANDLKRGGWVELEGDPWVVMDVTRQTPSARGASLLVKAKLRNLRSGSVQDYTFKGGDKLEEPPLEERVVQFLYSDGSNYHFMDQESYEQFELSKEALGPATGFLIDNLEGVKALWLGEEVIGVDLPSFVELRVTECPPPVKGGTSGNLTKIATLETGVEIQVPPYLEQGELVRVDTRDGTFVQRVKE